MPLEFDFTEKYWVGENSLCWQAIRLKSHTITFNVTYIYIFKYFIIIMKDNLMAN